MKNLLALVICAVLPSFAHATDYKIVGADGNTIASGQHLATNSNSVGTFTVDLLNTAHLQWSGDAKEITSIGNLDTKVVNVGEDGKAYGWCFKVNGVTSSKGAAETTIGNDDSVTWFYGYVRSVNGQWQNGCIPANQ